MPSADDTPDVVSRAVSALCSEDRDEARAALESIDFVAIRGARDSAHRLVWGPGGVASRTSRPPARPRDRTSKALKLATFQRDHFVCRYAHCRRRTIALPILKALSRALPDVLPYHSNWRPLEAHLLYWVFSTSLEHHVGFLHGGASTTDNLVTTCYGCNHLKNWLPVHALGWHLAAPAETGWDGLESSVPRLRTLGLITSRDL